MNNQNDFYNGITCVNDPVQTIKPQKVFLSGKMTGVEKFNFPKFDELEKRLRDIGIDCVNPANISRQFKLKTILENKDAYKEMIRRQMVEMMSCDTILLVGDNWNKSVGTRNEIKVALARDMNILLESDLSQYEEGFKNV